MSQSLRMLLHVGFKRKGLSIESYDKAESLQDGRRANAEEFGEEEERKGDEASIALIILLLPLKSQ
jgi:hypothetical protein